MKFITKEKLCYALMLLGVFCLFNLSLIIKRGHTYAAVILFIGSLLCLWKCEKKTVVKNKYMLFTFVIYALLGLFIGLFHGESGRILEHSLKFLLFIPIMLYLLCYPPTSLFVFVCAALGAVNVGMVAFWNKFYLGIPRAAEYLNPIFFAGISLLLVIFCLCGFKLAPMIQTAKRRYGYIILLFLGVVGGIVAVVLSASRGAWIAVPIILIAIMMLYRFTKLQASIFILVSMLLLSGTYFIPQTGVKSRVHQAMSAFQPNTKEFSVSARLEMWKIALPMFKERPLLGWGEKGADKEKQRLVEQDKAPSKLLHIGHWHNVFIDKAIKQGLLGVVSLLLLFVVPLIFFIREIKSNLPENRVLAYCGMLMVFSHIVLGMSDILLKFNVGTVFYCLPIIILLAVIENNKEKLEANERTTLHSL